MRAAWRGRGSRRALAAGSLALSPPLVHYVGLVFTEVPAALVLARALRGLVAPGLARARTSSSGRCRSCALPWFNVRYAPVTAIVLRGCARRAACRVGCRRTGRGRARLRGAAIALLPPRALRLLRPAAACRARGPSSALATLAEGLPGLAARPGVRSAGLRAGLRLLRAGTGAARARADAARGRGARCSRWPSWERRARGTCGAADSTRRPASWCRSCRCFAVALARALRGGLGAAGALRRRDGALGRRVRSVRIRSLVHRDRDGTAPFFRALVGRGGVDAPAARLRARGVGGRPLAADGRLDGRPRGRGPRAAARRAVGGRARARLRRRCSSPPERPRAVERRTGGRDAVRVIDRPALSRCRARAWSPGVAAWRPAVLDWGPLYEPHRHPAGAVVGSRLPLPPGRYRVEVAGGARSERSAPVLELSAGRCRARYRDARSARRRTVCSRSGGRAQAGSARSRSGCGAAGPIVLEEIRLVLQPSPSGARSNRPMNARVLPVTAGCPLAADRPRRSPTRPRARVRRSARTTGRRSPPASAASARRSTGWSSATSATSIACATGT